MPRKFIIPIVTFEHIIRKFPNIVSKSKRLAKNILPLYPSSKLVEIVATLLTDGHIDWYTSDGNPRTRKILLYSDYKKECQWFLNKCKDVFGIGGDIQKYRSTTGYSQKSSYKAIISNATLARILILAGAPAGDKTKTKYTLPNWIMKSDKKIKSIFLRTLFNFDGSVPHCKRDRPCSWQMGYSLNKQQSLIENGINFLRQIKSLLGEFDIKCGSIVKHKCNKDKYTLLLTISNQKSIVNFYQKIGFINFLKQDKLKKAVIEILKKGRIKSKELSLLLKELKTKFGSDKNTISKINKITFKNYTKRQFEHFRRSETRIPFEILFTAIKITNKRKVLNQLPDYVNTLWELFNSHYRSRFPAMNSSTIFCAT